MMHPRPFTALALAWLLAACDGAPGDPPVDAATALDRQDYFAARDAALAALRDDARDAAALGVLMRAQLAMGQGDDALTTLDRLAGMQALPADASLLAAEAQLQRGDLARAGELLAGETSSEAWRLRALIALQEGDAERAAAAFASGREAPGERFRLHAAEASWHLAEGDTAAAREAVALAQATAPGQIETLFVTARLAQLDGDAEQATRAFLTILDISAVDRPALLGAIEGLGQLGRMEALAPLVQRGLAAYPRDPDFAYYSALLKAEKGDWAGVRDLLQAREGDLPDHPPSRGLYGEALLELGQTELARSHLVPLYRQYPENPQVVRVFARILLANGEAARAREVIAPLAALPDALPEDRELAARAARG